MKLLEQDLSISVAWQRTCEPSMSNAGKNVATRADGADADADADADSVGDDCGASGPWIKPKSVADI